MDSTRLAATVFSAVLALALVGCSRGDNATPATTASQSMGAVAPVSAAPIAEKNPIPTVDTTTPDRALKSYWAVKDWIRATQHSKFDEVDHERVRKAYDLVTTGPTQRILRSRDYALEQFDREIESVKVETDSRAVAVAVIKNVTPIPQGAEGDARVMKVRMNGERYRYLLEKSAVGWGVSELSEWDDWQRQWRKVYSSAEKGPMIPHMTYEAR